MNVTIKQVAREAGVSIATVSRVLNGVGRVADDTRERVLAVAERLRYVPHGGARSLITRTSNAVGVLLPDIHGEFFSELLRGIDVACRERGFHLLVSGFHSSQDEVETMVRTMRGRVDGLVFMGPDLDPVALAAKLPETLPVVVLSCGASHCPYDSFSVDNRGGAAALVGHLAALGHRRIAHVAGPPGNADARERERGWRETLAARRLPHEGLLLRGDFTEEGGVRAGRALLAEGLAADAVFAANDSTAIGVLLALRDAGVRVPDEVAVCGFDDIPAARYLTPPLTSVRVPIAELGERATARLLDRVTAAAGAERCHQVLPTALVVRASCGATPAGAQPVGYGSGVKGRKRRDRV